MTEKIDEFHLSVLLSDTEVRTLTEALEPVLVAARDKSPSLP